MSDLLQVIDIWFLRRREEDRKDTSDAWEGSAAELLSSMTQDPGVKDLVKAETVKSFGRKLGLLVSVHSDRVFKLSASCSRGGTSRWKVIAPWIEQTPTLPVIVGDEQTG